MLHHRNQIAPIGRRTALRLGGAGIMVLASARAHAADVEPGKPAPKFSVADTKGQVRTLDEFKGKTVVLEWTATACPFVAAQYNSGNMQAVQRWAVERKVVWLSVVSTHASRPDYLEPARLEAFDSKRGASASAILMDPDGKLGRLYGARTTPHMYVVTGDGMLVYAGAIDDKPSYDAAVVKTSRNLVRAAIEDLEAGRPVATASTRPYGCAVGYGS